MAIRPETLATYEKVWALLEEGHNKSTTAEILEVNPALVTRAVKYAEQIGKNIQRAKKVDPNEVSSLDVSILLFQHEKEELLRRYPDQAILAMKLKSKLFELLAEEETQYEKGYNKGYNEAERILSRGSHLDRLSDVTPMTPEERKAAKEADKAKVNAYMNELMGWEDDENNDEPSAEERAKEKPQIPDTCGNCGSREIIVFEDDRLYQCDKCLHEDTY